MNQTIITNGLTVDELLASVRNIVRDEIQAIPKPEKVKPYLSLEEVCELLGLARQTVYSMTHKKQIPHIKRGGKLLFNHKELTDWLAASAKPVEK